MRVIIRRPQAYELKRQEPKTPIPGILFTDEEGRALEAYQFGGGAAEAAERLRLAMERAQERSGAAR